MTKHLASAADRYLSDPESVYNTWFLSSTDRMKAFRSIRRGVRETVEKITNNTFGNDFKGSPLEFVLKAITEQKQVFEGAAHPFYWKPKLRIPDIYENRENQLLFGSVLQACLTATREDQVLHQLGRISQAKIKGLGPAMANIIYFLHPTLIPPFNTAMVNGFNALLGENVKLGSWDHFFPMRDKICSLNASMRPLFSKDLGAFSGLLYEIGIGRHILPGNAEDVFSHEEAKREKALKLRHGSVLADQKQESEHTRMQHLLIDIGVALGYRIHVARNDRHRDYNGQSFSMRTLPVLPGQWDDEVGDTIALIDVLWLKAETDEIVCAFEVEKSTSIYSGILRMQDLARAMEACDCQFYLVAPGDREKEVMSQLTRPSFRASLLGLDFAYIPFQDLDSHCHTLCKFGSDRSILKKIAKIPTV